MAKNSNLHAAKTAKNDEFYTQLVDIENELKHYKDHFKGKVVYCNCDDAEESNFFKYFSLNFEHLGLKKLITSCYNENGRGRYLVYEGDKNGNNVPDADEIGVFEFEGNGDFRSAESIKLLKEADIVVTNPPFSLFREYIAQLMEYSKKFLVIGNMNAITYKEIFPLIKENKLWLGYNYCKEFIMPNGEIKSFGNINWYTNLEHDKRNEEIILYRTYNETDYPKYDNYDAINVNKVKDIPCDYDGVMGVPITFLDKYNPNQFEIVGLLQSSTEEQAGIPILREYGDFMEMRQDMTYTGAKGSKANGNPVLKGKSEKGNFLFNEKTNEYVHSVYARICIKRFS